MKILLDECLPKKLKWELAQHDVMTVPEKGWAGVKNGELLKLMLPEFDVFITVDQNLQYQQNTQQLAIIILVLVAPNNRFETLKLLIPEVLDKLLSAQPGEIVEIK